MFKKRLSITLLSLGLPLSSYGAAPSVAVDIAPLHSLVSQVMEGAGQPDLLIPAEASPHHYNLRPSQAKALSNADVVFWISEGLTPWLEKAIENVADSAQKVEMLELAETVKYEFREGATFEEHAHHEDEGHHDEHEGHEHHDEHKDHDHEEHAEHNDEHKDHDHEEHAEHNDEHDHEPGFFDRIASFFSSDDHDHHDEHKEHDHHEEHADHHDEHDDHHDGHAHHGADPHAWLDPANAKAWIEKIKTVLSEKDPSHADLYAQNATKAIVELDQLIETTSKEIGKLGDPKFIVFHDAYQYFEKRFGVSATGSISLGDAEDPSPARIEEIRDTVKKLGVSCVFTEPQYNAGLVENVFAGSTVTTIGVMDPLGASIQPGSDHYSELIKGMASSLSKCKG